MYDVLYSQYLPIRFWLSRKINALGPEKSKKNSMCLVTRENWQNLYRALCEYMCLSAHVRHFWMQPITKLVITSGEEPSFQEKVVGKCTFDRHA